MLKNKNILIGITGGIAAYKICELIRLFKKLNANVKIVLTKNSTEFVTQTTLMTLSQNQVYSDEFDITNWQPDHISLADWADIFVIAPVSANTIAKLSNGIADNLLTSLACAFQKDIIIAPAMNSNMWNDKFVQRNLSTLKEHKFHIIEPQEGFLACGYNGQGRMAEVEVIKEKTVGLLIPKQVLKNKKIVITAGGTKEDIDPVRFIGNYSSGKMGIALADYAHTLGAEVTLISTVKVNKDYDIKIVKSADEMLQETSNYFKDADILIMAAAVSDYRVKNKSEHKIKKDNETLTLELEKNSDILKEISKIKTSSQTIIGFCAESQNLQENALKKIDNKKLDFIIANDISKKDIGFDSDYNEVLVIDKNKNIKKLEKNTKENIAKEILEEIFK